MTDTMKTVGFQGSRADARKQPHTNLFWKIGFIFLAISNLFWIWQTISNRNDTVLTCNAYNNAINLINTESKIIKIYNPDSNIIKVNNILCQERIWLWWLT